MGKETDIQWCDSTLNLQMGCQGCELWQPSKGIKKCYAGTLTERMLRRGPLRGWPESFDKPAIFPARMDEAEKWGDLTGVERPNKPWLPSALPRLIFLDDMGDTFASGMPEGWLEPLVERMALTPHVWLFLTKRPNRQNYFFENVTCPKNVWCGASITSQQDSRLDELLATRCETLFLSVEPMFREITLKDAFERAEGRLKWVIIGGESGAEPGRCAPFYVDDCWRLVDECDRCGARPFVKQLGSNPTVRLGRPNVHPWAWLMEIKDKKGGDWSEWPNALRRREFPDVVRVRQGEMLI